MKALLKPKGRGACPTCFVARCYEAAQGGSRGYAEAGQMLAEMLAAQIPWEVEEDDWQQELHNLGGFLQDRDDDQVLVWFGENLPRCMALIPNRRRQQFLLGVHQAYEDETIQLEM